jgi:hypothetical protein
MTHDDPMTYRGVPPQIHPSELRPGRGWYVVAGLIVPLSLVGGLVLGLLVLRPLFGAEIVPPLAVEFDRSAPGTVQLTAAQKWVLYLDATGAASSESPAADTALAATCHGEGTDGGAVTLRPVTATITVGTGGRTWRELYTVRVDRDGRYTFSCEPTVAGALPARYAVGRDPEIGKVFGRAFGGFGVFTAVPCLGLSVALVIFLVTLVRRGSHKRRLQQRYAGLPPGTPPPGYPADGPPIGYGRPR